MRKVLIFFVTAIFLAGTIRSISQETADTLRPRYGGFANVGLNFHAADFRSLPGVPSCCPLFERGSGFGYYIGGLYQRPISEKLLLGARAGIYSQSGALIKEESETVVVDLQETQGVFEHEIKASLSTLSIEPMVSYRVWEDLFLNLGFNAGIYASKSYEQKEEIVSPSDVGVFVGTESRIRNQTSGDIQDVSSLAASAIVGANYQLPLDEDGTLLACPEIFYSYGFTNVVQDRDWKISSLRAGISIKFTPFQTVKVYEENHYIDTIEVESTEFAKTQVKIGEQRVDKTENKSDYRIEYITDIYRTDTLQIRVEPPPPPKIVFEAGLEAVAELEGRRADVETIQIQVQLRKEVYPLLPYVFFDINSAEIPDRYNQLQPGESFDADALYPNPITYHRNNLNVIARRIKGNLNATLTIHGYVDPTTERDDCNLAARRAEAVKNYFVNVHGVDSRRIAIESPETGCYPENTTRTKSEAGYAENRRVEISSSHPGIVATIKGKRYQDPEVIDPKQITFKASCESSENNAEIWFFNLEQDDDVYLVERGEGCVNKSFVFEISDENAHNLSPRAPLEAEITVTNSEGETARASEKIYVMKDTNNVEIESLTLTLFQVSQYKLNDFMKTEIRKFVAGLGELDIIHITGFSDNLGDSAENLRLSGERAGEVANYIRSLAPNAQIVTVDGVGSRRFPQGVESYQTPEERFLSRTVAIEIFKSGR